MTCHRFHTRRPVAAFLLTTGLHQSLILSPTKSGRFPQELAFNTARELNKEDKSVGRKVWFNFWDSKLTFEKSYLARLNYVHQNAVKHGLVLVGNRYPWCSAAWFERTASRAMVKTIYGFKIDRLKIDDDY